MPEAYTNIISEESAKSAFNAGRADRNASIDAKYAQANEAVIYDGGLIQNHNTEVMPAETNEVLEKLGKMFGVTVEVQDKVYGNVGDNAKYSISEIVGKKQNYGEGVILDTDIFNGVKTREWNKTLTKFVYDELAGQDIVVRTEDGSEKIISFAKYNERVKKDGANNSHRVIDKLARAKGNINTLSIVHIEELLKTSKIYAENQENSHQWLDTNGWEHARAYLQDMSGNIYETTLNIAKAKDGRNVLYALSNTKRIEDAAVSSTSKEEGLGRNINPFDKRISQKNGVVKTKFSKNSKIDIEVNGSYGNGEVKLSYDKMLKSGNIGEAALFIINHEIAHRVQELAPKEYQKFRDLALDVAITGDRAVYINSYAERVGLTYDEACDEIVADVVGNEKFAQKFAEKDIGTAEKVKNWIKDILDRLGLWKYTESERLYRTWEKAVEKAQKQIEKNKTKSNNVNKQGNIKYSMVHLPNGESYWQIETDKDIFKNLQSVKELQKAAYDYILTGNKGTVVTDLIDGKELKFIRVSAKEYVYGRHNRKL